MIRFRVGQSWKRERSAPVDSFGLSLDGVELLMGASEEPLARVVPNLLEAVWALFAGRHLAQLSLHEADLELALSRRGNEVRLAVASLGRPARLTRPSVAVDLSELAQAAVRCGRRLMRDLAEAAPTLLRAPRHRQMMRRLAGLERALPAQQRPTPPEAAYRHRTFPPAAGSFGFEVSDPEGLLLAFSPREGAGLSSLLVGGAVTLKLSESAEWRGEGPPFLLALEISRQASELLGAIESGEELSFAPGGAPPPLTVCPRRKEVVLWGRAHPLPADRLARGMFELGLGVSLAIAARNKAQRRNPYLIELEERCKEGLLQLGQARPPEEGAAHAPRRRSGSGRPLRAAGKLRRLRFEPLWEKLNLGGDDAGRLLLSARGPVFSSRQMAMGFARTGEMLFRRVDTHGVAASSDGYVLNASLHRLVCFSGSGVSALWLKDHDGLAIGPELHLRDGLLLVTLGGSGLAALCAVTGRELWRLDPPRTQVGHLAFQGHRALLATDAGVLYGLDVKNGQLRFRMRAAMPFAGPTLPFGRRLVALVSRGERSALFSADAHKGTIAWTRQLSLRAPSRPIAIAGRLLLAGWRDEESTLLCFSGQGQPLWERRLHLGQGLSLLPVGRSALAWDQSGGAVLVNSDGRIDWRLGSAGEELLRPVPACLSRGVLLVPGETVRAVDPRGGRILAEVRAGADLCDLKVDGKLNLYLLDQEGTISAWRLSSHLAVV